MIRAKPYGELKYRDVKGRRMAHIDDGDGQGDAIVFQHGQLGIAVAPLSQVSQDQYMRLPSGDHVTATGAVAPDGNRVVATSIQRRS